MRTLLYQAPRRMRIADRPRPRPAPGEVEVAVAAAALCGLDLAGFRGGSRHCLPGQILGHEFAGRLADGSRVAVDPLMGCGGCAACRGHAPNLCPQLRLLGHDGRPGCLAEFVSVPRSQLYPIPDGLPDERALLAEPLANIVHLFRLAGPPADARLAIVGAGVMGALALQLARHRGVRALLVSDVENVRLDMARQMGATHTCNPLAQPPAARSAADAGGFDLVLDACGTEAARQQAFALCRPAGTVVLLGMAEPRSTLDFGAGIRRELRVVTSFGYTPADFRHALRLLAEGAADLAPWTAVWSLDDGQQAFEAMTTAPGPFLKAVLRLS